MCALVAGAQATTLHVGAGQTYATIGDAVSACSADDTIMIHEGRYADYDMTSDDGKNNLTFMAAPGENAIVDGKWSFRFHSGMTFDGLIINRESWLSSGVGRSLEFYVEGDGSDDITIKNCIFHAPDHDASNPKGFEQVYSRRGSTNDNLTIENCTFYNLYDVRDGEDPYMVSMLGSPSNWVIKDSIFVDNDGGVYVENSAGDVTYSAFYNNKNDVGGTASKGDGCVSDQPFFVSTDYNDEYYMWLTKNTPSSIVTGDSDGSYMGARPQIPEPATLVLLGIGGLALIRKRR